MTTARRLFDLAVTAAEAAHQVALAEAKKTIDAIPAVFRGNDAVRHLTSEMVAAADRERNAALAKATAALNAASLVP
jgi:hypothetical protein